MLINVRVARGFDWQRQCRDRAGACGGRSSASGKRGRLLLRASGTEPVLRVMVEGEDAGQVEAQLPRSWRASWRAPRLPRKPARGTAVMGL